MAISITRLEWLVSLAGNTLPGPVFLAFWLTIGMYFLKNIEKREKDRSLKIEKKVKKKNTLIWHPITDHHGGYLLDL